MKKKKKRQHFKALSPLWDTKLVPLTKTGWIIPAWRDPVCQSVKMSPSTVFYPSPAKYSEKGILKTILWSVTMPVLIPSQNENKTNFCLFKYCFPFSQGLFVSSNPLKYVLWPLGEKAAVISLTMFLCLTKEQLPWTTARRWLWIAISFSCFQAV